MQRTIGGILVRIRATAILPGWVRPYYNAAPGCDACAFVFHLRHRHGDSFHNDHFPDLKADYILANPPFNDSGPARHSLMTALLVMPLKDTLESGDRHGRF